MLSALFSLNWMTYIPHKIVQSQGKVAAGEGSDKNKQDYSYFTPTPETADLSANSSIYK